MLPQCKKRNRGNGECRRPRHCDRSYQFVIAVWRAKMRKFGLTRIVHSFKNKYFNNICAAL
jgi:hypothetical protein